MAIPNYQSIMLPLLRFIQDGKEHTPSEAIDHLADYFKLKDEEKKELLPSGMQLRAIFWILLGLAAAGGRLIAEDNGHSR